VARDVGGIRVNAIERHFVLFVVAMLSLLGLPASALAALSPDPSSYDWGNVNRYGTSPSQTFTFTNDEGSSVNVSSVSLSGTDASEFSTFNNNCSGAFLNDGDSCSVAVQVQPSSSGAKSASLDVDDGIGTASVALSANAQAGTLTVNPNPIAFNPQPWYFGGQFQNANVQTSSFGTTITSVTITGPDAGLFSINGGNCAGTTLFSFNGCGIGLNFNPSGPTGPASANLVITSDSPSSPTTTPITAAALSGPDPNPSPSSEDYGAVKVGSASSSRTIQIANDGDFDLQVQQLLVVSGTPQAFPVANDNCSGRVVPAGNSCTFRVAFAPTTEGLKEASIFLIANTPGPVTQIPLSGHAYPAPSAAAVVSGTPAVGSALTCKTSHVSGALRFRWLRGGKQIAGATGSRRVATNADYGKRLACQVTAHNPVGSVTVKSPPTVPLAARNLADEPHSLVNEGSCRVVSVAPVAGVEVSGTYPATPESPLTFSSSKPVRVELGPVDERGRSVRIAPRELSSLGDGPQPLKVNRKSTSLVLAPCKLSASVAGSGNSQVRYELSGAIAIRKGSIKTPKLAIAAGRGIRGQATVFAHGRPQVQFPLTRSKTSYNGIKVRLRRHAVGFRHLPGDTGTVVVDLKHGLVHGSGGKARASATLKGGLAARAAVRTLWK
jgi:hypothetical protein